MTTQSPFRIRRAHSRDRPAVLSLLRHWIRDRPVELHYPWLHESHPHGRAVTWVAEDRSSGQLIGCTSCFPRRFLVRGSIVLGSVGGDTLVHPDWRGMGVAMTLHRMSNQDLPRLGLRFHCGFPNVPNSKALQKAGVGSFKSFRHLALPLSTKAFRFLPNAVGTAILRYRLARRKIHREQNLEELSPDEGVWKELESLWEDARQGFLVGLDRDASFFRWRYEKAPGKRPLLVGSRRRGKLEGFAAVREAGPRRILSDFFARTEEAARGLLAQLETRLGESGADVLSVTLNSLGPYYKSFRRMGFVPRDRPPFSLYIVPGSNPLPEELNKLLGWHVMAVDLDYWSGELVDTVA